MGRLIIVLIALLTLLVVWRRPVEQSQSGPSVGNPVAAGANKKLQSPVPSKTRRVNRTVKAAGEEKESELAVLAPYFQQGWSGDWLAKRLDEEKRFANLRETNRRDGADSELNQETWRNEDWLFDLSHSLRLGMTAQEVTDLLGKPLRGVNPEELPTPGPDYLDAGLERFSPYGGDKCEWKYSPSGKVWRRMDSPSNYQVLVVGFGRDNRVRMWFWAVPTY